MKPNNIQYFRILKKLSQEDMADKLNISTSTYGKIERGETNIIHKHLREIANILDVEVHQLLPEYVTNHFENNNIHIGIVQTDHYHEKSGHLNESDLIQLLLSIQQQQIKLSETQDRLVSLLEQLEKKL